MQTVSADQFKQKYGDAAVASFKQPSTPIADQSYASRVSGSIAGDLANRINRFDAIQKRTDTGLVTKGVQMFGQGAGLAAHAAETAVTEVPGIKQAVQGIGAGISWLSTSELSPIKHLGDIIGSNKTLQAATQLYDSDPSFKDTIDAVANIVRLGGDVQTAVQSANFAANVTNKVIRTVKDTTASLADTASQSAIGMKDKIQLAVSSKNVDPQLEASANRLFLEGTRNVSDPIATYDSFLVQSKKALTDIKTDPAISVVGNEMGDAFNKVIAQRRAVGATIGKELKTVGKLKTSIVEPRTTLMVDLKDSGLAYNPKTNQLTSFTGSKFAPEEVSMLENYVKGIISLGDTPSISTIDNFISKTRSTLEFTKGKTGVIGTTNAERIINASIKNLRETLNPAKNGLSQLTKYWDANKTYSDLSNFVEEGSRFLGKTTQSGDFVKDASVAKSAVQSILNNGKKDWMIQLEKLTGYPALDKAVLALQAMKDAGDFRGLSLLQSMSEGAIPTSQSGFVKKILDFALSHGAKLIVGTPEEQTRAFLTDLLKSPPQTSK